MSVCVVAIVDPTCKSYLRCFILSRVVCLAAPHFSTLFDKRYDFRGVGDLLNIRLKCVKFYSHQLMHFLIRICISLLSYIKIT